MDIDADFATQEHSIIQSVEDGVASTSALRTFGSEARARSPTPGSQQLLPSGNTVISQLTSQTMSKLASNGMDQPATTNSQSKYYHNIQVVLPRPKYERLLYATSASGLVYDVRMRYHLDPGEGEEAHPERPRRIVEIFNELVDAGLAVDPRQEDPENDPSSKHKLVRIMFGPATKEEICLIHSREHVDNIEGLKDRTKAELEVMSATGDSIYYHHLSWLCATLAAGGAIEAARAVVGGHVRNAIAVIRPPGHHAEHGMPSGFCFFNNVCIAARVCQREFPETCRKILIMDWDVHHGNGIQQAFERDPNVLYISTHVYKNGGFYPFTNYGDHTHCGLDEGLGRNVNIPWSEQGMTDADYMLAFQQVVMPIATEFDPDLVFIAAGFDAAEGDELGACHVSPAGFAHMTHMLKGLAKGKVVACLEGGYNLRSIAKSATAMTRVLMGEPPERLPMGDALTPTPSAVATIHKVIRTQASFWRCMFPKNLQMQHKHSLAELGSERLHDIIRAWQSKVMWDEFGMSELFILRQKISKSFKDQVLATRNYHEDRPLVVIFHDPPETHGFPDMRTNKLELHNTWLTDPSKSYVEWAIKHEFAVIDINIPKHITDVHDTAEYADTDPEKLRADSAREIAYYIWTNYIETSSRQLSTPIFLLGIGDAYSGILELLSHHATAIDTVALTSCFVASHALRSVQRSSDDDVAREFFKKSQIFVAPTHAAFDPARAKKLKRRYGNVIRCESADMLDMLVDERSRVTSRWEALSETWREGGAGMDVDEDS